METGIIHSGPANYFRGLEAVGGKLFLYADRLYFESHGIAINANSQTVYLHEISEMKKRNAMGIIPNGLTLVLKNGKKEKFVVQKREVWMEKISAAVAASANK